MKKQKQLRRESATILENFQSIEEFVWSYSRSTRDKLFVEDTNQPWSYLEPPTGPIYDGRLDSSSARRPWVTGGKITNPIFDDTSNRGTLEHSQHPLERPWRQAGQSYDIGFTDSLQRELNQWKKDERTNEEETWTRAKNVNINPGRNWSKKIERDLSVRSGSIGFGDSLHRELYQWANQGKPKRVDLHSIRQHGNLNATNARELGRRVSAPAGSGRVIHNKEIVKVSDRHRKSVPVIIFSHLASSSQTVNQNEDFTPKMNKKRITLRYMQTQKQQKSGTGHFYTKNQKMFENYKRNIREGGAPEVLYFHY